MGARAPSIWETVAAAAIGVALHAMPLGGTAADGDGWKAAGTEHGVALAFRENQALRAREVRATAEIPFPPALVLSTVCDLPAYPTFVPGIVEARTLEGSAPASYTVYVRYAPRFLLIAPRDVVLQVRSDRAENGTWQCAWHDVPNQVPRKSGTVRMPLDVGTWLLEPIGEARTRAVYQVAVKPGGMIPDWLVRWGATRALPEVMAAVQKRLESITRNPT